MDLIVAKFDGNALNDGSKIRDITEGPVKKEQAEAGKEKKNDSAGKGDGSKDGKSGKTDGTNSERSGERK